MFLITLDLSSLEKMGEGFKNALERESKIAGQKLVLATHSHILEQTKSKLRSTRQKYEDALSFSQVDDDTWLIELDPSAFFIEEGMEPHEMIDDLLGGGRPGKKKREGGGGGGIKTALDGSKYRAIPFMHNKAPTQQTSKQTSLTNMVKEEMKSRGIAFGGLEKTADGTAKTGLLHSFDVGRTKAGTPPMSKQGISLLAGVRVYQNKVKDKHGKEIVQKNIMTFRMVSTKQKGKGLWMHPGIEPRKFLDEAYAFALDLWHNKIFPELASKMENSF